MLTLDTVAEFTWDFGQEFFLETVQGNFIWSDPDYNGDNTIRPYAGSYRDWCFGRNAFGRAKGSHTIRGYCGENVKILLE